MSSGNPDVTDRWCRGHQRPWDSAGRHVYILNKPEQLRGPLSPHRKAGTQNWEAGISGPSVVACVPLSTQGRLCVLDSQDSCCPLFFSLLFSLVRSSLTLLFRTILRDREGSIISMSEDYLFHPRKPSRVYHRIEINCDGKEGKDWEQKMVPITILGTRP